MGSLVSRFWADDAAATAIEYGLIAAMIATACIAAFVAFGGNLGGLFGWVNTKAGGAMDGSG